MNGNITLHLSLNTAMIERQIESIKTSMVERSPVGSEYDQGWNACLQAMGDALSSANSKLISTIDPRWADIDFDKVNAELRDLRDQVGRLQAHIDRTQPVQANAEGYVQPQAQVERPSIEAERKRAEIEYSYTAHNYPDAPIGSRDWTLYWAGWLARSTAHPQATEPALTEHDRIKAFLHKHKASALPEGTCITCQGQGEIGGQFCGGFQACPDCDGSSKLAAAPEATNG